MHKDTDPTGRCRAMHNARISISHTAVAWDFNRFAVFNPNFGRHEKVYPPECLVEKLTLGIQITYLLHD